MQTRKNKLTLTLAAASTLAFLPSTAQAISVNVNGSPVNFTGAPPVEVNGAVLVPLRGVFEAMGAGVNYDSAAHTITAKKGSQVVILPLGSSTASVNGQTQVLSQPARVENGTTLVPLRFVAEALGGYVQWQAAQNLVAITTQDSHLSNLPPAPGSGTVVGQLTGVFTNTNPQQITVRVNGENTTIPITGDTVILRSEPGATGQQVALSDIQVGDQVTVHRDDQGYASTITSKYGELRGTVKSIGTLADGRHVVTLNDGTTVQLAPDAMLRMNGRRIQMSDIMADERVLIRTNPSDNLGYELLLNPQGQVAGNGGTTTEPNVKSLFVHSTHLAPGDTFTATLAGTPGGTANFSIPGAIESIPTIEEEPGLYRARFKVPAGVSIDRGAVYGQLSVGGYASPRVKAPQRVTIDSFGARTSVGSSNSPVILSPVDGASVSGTITVTGTARPLSTVHVSVDYKTTGGLFNTSGNSATRDVTADSAGYWSVEDLPLTGNPLVSNNRNTQYTITAVSVNQAGVRSAASTISVEGGRVYAHRAGQN